MKPSFIHHPVNGPFEDPCLYVRIMREKRALLFDIGDISALRQGELYKITDVFISHTHIDHFIGFDFLLRAILRRDTSLRVYGPSNIAECMEGKLKGYTWNHIKEYPLNIDVFAVNDNTVEHSGFYAENAFKRTDFNVSEFRGILLEDPAFTVKAFQLDHQIPCLGFTLEEDYHININKAVLTERGLPVGPWLSEFKKAVRMNKSGETEFIIEGRKYTLEMLMDISSITRGQKIAYITDVSPFEENIRKIIAFVRGSDVLYCETYFMEKDRSRAAERYHLTSGIAGKIAGDAGVKELVAMHFSPKYLKQGENPGDEAMEFFRNQAF